MDEDLRKRLDEAAARFRAGESDVEEVRGPTGTFRIVRDAATPQGFRVEAEVDGETMPISIRAFPASSTPPEDYPPGIPFLENCPAMFDAGKNRLVWMNPPEPERAFNSLVASSIESGWEEVVLPPVRANWEGRRQAEFRMPGKERTLTLNVKGTLSVLELLERQPRSRKNA